MKFALLFLLSLALASAQTIESPAALADTVYRESLVSGTSTTTYSVRLRANGTFSSLVIRSGATALGAARSLAAPEDGTYTYVKSGPSTGLLLLQPAVPSGVTNSHIPRTLTFTAAGSGTVAPAGLAASGVFGVSPTTIAYPLINVSTRGLATSGTPLIIGFIVAGPIPRDVVLRGLGPGLPVPNAASDASLQLYVGTTPVHSNENWGNDGGSPYAAATMARAAEIALITPLASQSLDAATVVTLPPGAYTMHVYSNSPIPVEVLGEAYLLP